MQGEANGKVERGRQPCCHCEAQKGPWQSREGTADIHRVPPNAIAIKFDCSGASSRAPHVRCKPSRSFPSH